MSLYTLLTASHQLRVGAANFTAVTAAGAYATDALALGPWAYHRMGEAPGAVTMVDASGNSRDGSYIGTPLFGQVALVQQAGEDTGIRLQSDGSYGEALAFQGAAFTLALTVQLADVVPQSVIAEQDFLGGPGGWSLECINGKLRAYIRDSGSAANWILDSTTGFGALVAGQRHTVAVSFGAGGAELWIDGTRVAHEPALVTAPTANTQKINLGSYHGTAGIADGFLDEAVIFARQLNSGEHATLARPDTISIPPPVAQDDPSTGRHAVTVGTAQQFFPVLANDTSADDIVVVNTPSPNIGAAARVVQSGVIGIGYTPPASVASATNVDVSHTVSGPGGTDTAVLRLTVNPVAAVLGYPCLDKSGSTPIPISGDRNSSLTLRRGDPNGTRYDLRNLICRVVNGGNQTPGNQVALLLSSVNGCSSGGQFLGENLFSEAWGDIYDRENNACYEIGRDGPLTAPNGGRDVSNQRIDNAYGYNTWDFLRINGGNSITSPPVIEHCYVEHCRDDVVESDGLWSTTVRDCLFDGVFSGISARNNNSWNPPGDHDNIIEDVLMRMYPYRTGGARSGSTNGPNHNPGHMVSFKWDLHGPRLRVRNMIIAVSQDANVSGIYFGDIMADYRWELSRSKILESSNNRIVSLGSYNYATAQGGRASLPGWTFTTDDNVWWDARAAWLSAHPEVVQHKRPSMPSGLSLNQP